MNIPSKLPSQARLRELFDYVNGDLYWRQSGRGRRTGVPAGTTIQRGYRATKVGLKRYLNHRLVWMWCKGKDPGYLEIDHINRDTSDNRIENLRAVTSRENNLNMSKRKRLPHYAHLPTGIYEIHEGGNLYYSAQVSILSKQNFVGRFDSIDRAVAARNKFIQSINPNG